MKRFTKIFSLLLTLCLILSISMSLPASHAANSSFNFVILSRYSKTVDIGDSFYLMALTSTGKLPTWKSSSSSIASVNTYGKVTAKKAGSCTITAKIKGAEASCKVTVRKTKITLNSTSVKLENNKTFRLKASTSNGSSVTWSSNRKSIATVDENGLVKALKPGQATISAQADGTTVTCTVIVNKPTISLNRYSASLYRNHIVQLTAKVSSGIKPVWKSSNKSVATVNSYGFVRGLKHGTAVITATVDGVSKSCTITVKSPEITLNTYDITLKAGQTYKMIAKVSSGNKVTWSSSNKGIAAISESGLITALKKGTATIYAKEDGAKERCTVHIIE